MSLIILSFKCAEIFFGGNAVLKMPHEWVCAFFFSSKMLTQAESEWGQIASRGPHRHHVKGIKSTDLHGIALPVWWQDKDGEKVSFDGKKTGGKKEKKEGGGHQGVKYSLVPNDFTDSKHLKLGMEAWTKQQSCQPDWDLQECWHCFTTAPRLPCAIIQLNVFITQAYSNQRCL